MFFLAEHNGLEPRLDLRGIPSRFAIGAQGVDISVLVVDQGNRGNEVLKDVTLAYQLQQKKIDNSSTYSSARNKRLNNSALLGSLLNIINSQSALHSLERRKLSDKVLRQTLAHELQNTATGNTGQNELIVKRSSNKLQLAFGVVPDNEEVTGTSLGDLAVRPEQPQDLIVAQSLGLAVGLQRRTVVRTQLGIAEAAGPGTDGIRGRGVESKALGGLGLGILLHFGHVGPGDSNNEEEGFLGHLDAQVRTVSDDCWTDVEVRTGVGEPA